MRAADLEWGEFLRLLGPLPEKGPRSEAVAKAAALRIIKSFRRRVEKRAEGQTCATRRSSLTRIQATAVQLVEALIEAGPECQEELNLIGECVFAPEQWIEDEVSLSHLADLGRIGSGRGIDELASVPRIALRIAALNAVVEEALANPKLASSPGKGKKLVVIGDATPAMRLVSECWDLLVLLGLDPAGGATGRLNNLACEVGALATEGIWNLDRLKREIAKAVRSRLAFHALESAFDQAWDESGSPLLRPPLPGDQLLRELAEQMEEMIEGSEGLLHPTQRLTAWKGFMRLNRARARSERNTQEG